MKKNITILIFLFCSLLLFAQNLAPWQYVRHSAKDINNQVHVRFNGTPDALANYEMYNWQNNSWQSVTLNEIEPFVFEALLPASVGQTLKWRLRSQVEYIGGTTAVLNPAFLSSDTFPPALASLAYIADDPVGDSVMVYYPNLDLTGTWFGWTNTKLYAAISNVSNTFPNMNSFTSYNMYFSGLINSATTITDSTIYAMIYTFSIPGVISSGLYKLGWNGTLPTFQRLGNIQSQVVGGKLMLSCNIADLIADPAFGGWPPQFNTLFNVAGSMRININPQNQTPSFNVGDYSALGQLIFENYSYQVLNNNLPSLTDISLTNNITNGILSFIYNDINQDFPLTAKAILNNGDELQFITTLPDFTQAVDMTTIVPLTGWQTAEIRVSDNNIDFVTYNIINTHNEDDTLPVQLSYQIYPNPYQLNKGELTIKLNKQTKKPITLKIYNVKGECLKTIVSSSEKTAITSWSWDGTSDAGDIVCAGLYILRFYSNDEVSTRKILVLR